MTMKTLVLLTVLSVTATLCQAQIDFQPGYYLRNDGTRISCLIKDYGWLNNPKEIVCKSSAASPAVTLVMDSVAEFAVGNAKYQRFEIEVETSSDEVDQLDNSPTLNYRRETAFLKLLVEGRASLYQYYGKQLNRFFFRLNGGEPRLLVYKRYFGENNVILAYEKYRRQLLDSLNCEASDFADVTRVDYEAKSLSRFFIAYDNCIGVPYANYFAKETKTVFHLNLRAGADLSTFNIHTADGSGMLPRHEYGAKSSFRIAAEAELLLPFNHNKWALVFEPAYRSYNSNAGGAGFEFDFKAFELALGGRYYAFIGQQTKLYFTAELYSDFHLSTTIRYNNIALDPGNRAAVKFGSGLQFNRIGVEVEYAPSYDPLDNYEVISSNLTTLNLNISYRIL